MFDLCVGYVWMMKRRDYSAISIVFGGVQSCRYGAILVG